MESQGKGVRMAELLGRMVARGASDVHLQAGAPPHIRVDGELRPWEASPKLKPAQTEQIALAMMTEDQQALFLHRHELDFAFTIPEVARFRCNAYRQRGSVAIAMRVIGDAIPGFEALGLPSDVVSTWAEQPRGLVLVTGPTGSGKTTSLAAMVDYINRRFARNVITVEDPIEILHRNQKSLVIQREVGLDTADFVDALKYAMRQDPDVIMIGEMRDTETAKIAVQSALTGHLVLSTLHTNDALSSITRMMDMGVESYLLSSTINAILAQRLVRTLCAKCKKPHILSDDEIMNWKLAPFLRNERTIYRAGGCDECGHTGYSGRSAIIEILILSNQIRKLITNQADQDIIYRTALDEGLRTMYEDGMRKVAEGTTTIEEVLRITQEK